VLERVEFDGTSEEVTLAFRLRRPARDNQLVEEAA
jgi:hypothetical protein